MLTIKNIHKSYGGGVILEDISLTVTKGAVLSILGKSGGGKTTLLKIIAGLLPQDRGMIEMEDCVMDNIPAHQRQIIYLYQEPLLFPHLNVFENLAFGLRLRKENKSAIVTKVEKIATELELSAHLSKMPGQLSGGQRQRVSFGRALILNPKILLLDEPFGNLDAQTRKTMQELFKKVAQEHNITAIFVTHDLKEALIVGDRLGMLQRGKINLYNSKDAFINDINTGASEEIAFWQQMLHLKR